MPVGKAVRYKFFEKPAHDSERDGLQIPVCGPSAGSEILCCLCSGKSFVGSIDLKITVELLCTGRKVLPP